MPDEKQEPTSGPYKARIVGILPPSPRMVVSGELRDARFQFPKGTDVVFEGARVERVDFTGLRFTKLTARASEFIDCDFRRASFAYLRVRESQFIDCDFGRARFAARNCTFDEALPSVLTRCRFDKGQMPHFGVGTSRFEACTFRDAKVSGWRSECGEFVDCIFACKITDSVFYGRPTRCYERLDEVRQRAWDYVAKYGDDPDEAVREAPRRLFNQFRGNDFSEAEFDYVDMRSGIDMAAQTWPQAPEYMRFDRWPERLERARAAVDAWDDSPVKEEALMLLKIYGSGGSEEQAEAILTPRFTTGYYSRRGAGQRLLELFDQA